MSCPQKPGAAQLELHPGKTRIVYCKDINRTSDHPDIQFTFLGYTFRPLKALDKYGRVYVNFSPAVSHDALKAMRQTIRGWHLEKTSEQKLFEKEERRRKLLEKLGFVQLMFDFYTAPVA